MSTLVISSFQPFSFGSLTNQSVQRLISLESSMQRLKDAIATASAGYPGVPGTQFEAIPNVSFGTVPNLFGVQPNDTPGQQGESYRFAMDSLMAAWETFLVSARPFIAQLDNGPSLGTTV